MNSEFDGNVAMDELKGTGDLKIQVNGQEVVLTKATTLTDDMAQMEGYVLRGQLW